MSVFLQTIAQHVNVFEKYLMCMKYAKTLTFLLIWIVFKKMSITEHQLSEKELQLHQKNREIQSLQKELEVSKSELNHLQDQIASERKKAAKQILSLKEAMKMQRMQLERKLHVSPG